jgi:hypothetical protein
MARPHPKAIRFVLLQKASIGLPLASNLGNWQAVFLPFSAGRSSLAKNSPESSKDASRQPVARRS